MIEYHMFMSSTKLIWARGKSIDDGLVVALSDRDDNVFQIQTSPLQPDLLELRRPQI